MIEIEEPPTVAACSSCMLPIGWLWSWRRKVWLSVVREEDDDNLFRIHECGVFGQATSWRHLVEQPAEVKQRGAALARAVLKGQDPFTEEES